jgi:hypothetical protein
VEDTFDDGERETQNLPESAAWYLLNDNAVVPSATVTGENELAWLDKAGTYSGLIAFFTPEAQTHSLAIGDSLKFEFRIALENLSAALRVVRVGMMNSGGRRISADALNTGATGLAVGSTFTDWRGYALLTSADAVPVAGFLSIVERAGANAALWSSGAYSQLGDAVDTPAVFEFEFYPVELTVTRRAAEVEVSGRFGDMTIGPVVDASNPVTAFDTVALFVQPQIGGLRVDDVRVTFIPNPAPADDPDLIVLTETVFGRLPIDAPSPVGTVSIRNAGASQTLTIAPASTVSGPDAAHYQIETALPLMIAPGVTGIVEVAFTPETRFGDFTAILELHSNDPGQPILPVDLDARYFHRGDQLLDNPDLEADPFLTGWNQTGVLTDIPGLITNSTRAAFLNAGALLGQTDLVVPGDFELEFRFAIQDPFDQESMELLLKTFPGFDENNPFLDLRYASGQFHAFSNGAWSEDLGLGTLETSLDANVDGDLDDPEDTRNIYRLRLTAHGWGGDNPSYDLALTEADSDEFTREVTGLTAFVGGGGGGASPPAILVFSAANNPGYWIDDVRLTAGLPASPGFAITDVTRDPATGRVTLTWNSVATAAYDVEAATEIDGDWSAIGTDLAGMPGTTQFTDANPASGSRFYRIVRK